MRNFIDTRNIFNNRGLNYDLLTNGFMQFLKDHKAALLEELGINDVVNNVAEDDESEIPENKKNFRLFGASINKTNICDERKTTANFVIKIDSFNLYIHNDIITLLEEQIGDFNNLRLWNNVHINILFEFTKTNCTYEVQINDRSEILDKLSFLNDKDTFYKVFDYHVNATIAYKLPSINKRKFDIENWRKYFVKDIKPTTKTEDQDNAYGTNLSSDDEEQIVVPKYAFILGVKDMAKKLGIKINSDLLEKVIVSK